MQTAGLGTGARIAAISAVVLLVAMIAVGWFRIDSVTADDHQGNVYEHAGSQLVDVTNEDSSDVTANAWKSFAVIDIFLAIAGVGGLALAAVRARGRGPGASVFAIAVGGFAGLALVLLFFRALSPPDLLDAYGIAEVPNVSLDAEIGRLAGLYIGIAACAGIVLGAFRVMTEDAPG